MSHRIGTHQVVSPVVTIGPDSGSLPTSVNTWLFNFPPAPRTDGNKVCNPPLYRRQFPGPQSPGS
jgi:hypothetical protein